ncbi:MAG: hypothetical protein ACFFB3_11810 [Candidatus Hodarchaeota archaeon]
MTQWFRLNKPYPPEQRKQLQQLIEVGVVVVRYDEQEEPWWTLTEEGKELLRSALAEQNLEEKFEDPDAEA